MQYPKSKETKYSNKYNYKGLRNPKERKAIKDYEQGTLRVVNKATRKGTALTKEEGVRVRSKCYQPKEYISRRFINKYTVE